MQKSIEEYYRARQQECEQEIKQFARRINIYSFLRLFALIFGIVLFYQALRFELVWLSVLIVLLLILGFYWLVSKQANFQKRLEYFSNLSKVHANELSSLNRIQNLYTEGSEHIDDFHSYTSDLDIFGKGSLFEMMNRCSTTQGNTKLVHWLQVPASVKVIRERQAAVLELSSRLSWKHHYQAVLLFSNKANEDQSAQLLKYLTTITVKPTNWFKLYVQWIPLLFLILAIGSWFLLALLIPLSVLMIYHLILIQSYSSRILKTDSMIGKMSRILNQFSEGISAISNENWQSAMCNSLAEEMKGEGRLNLSEQVKRFSLLINHLTFGLTAVGSLLNIIILWNIRQLFAIEDWKRENYEQLKKAFDVLASFESLISLSALNTNNPEWCFASINENEKYTLNAKSIGHPLISESERIDNNYSLDNELKIDIITGSNMAGKSTFLRTLGINTVLALCGAPSCASTMDVSRMLVFTYMRIRDSLNESTSTFKAELDRLQALIRMREQPEKVYFLIDEMLRGTNSVDKYLGSKAVIEKLIAQSAVGIVATHDLQIAKLEEKYPNYIRNYYFDIQIVNNEMKFDYKLKEGECKTFNASLLLQKIGIYPEGHENQA